MTVEILLRVTRDGDNRLDGSARPAGRSGVWTFSGTLELLRVLEELVPAADDAAADAVDRPDAAGA